MSKFIKFLLKFLKFLSKFLKFFPYFLLISFQISSNKRIFFLLFDKLQNRQYKYYSTGLLSTVDLYDNPYSCNIKEEVEDESSKAQTKKRKYNKTGKYKKTNSEHQKEGVENAENNVWYFELVFWLF